MTRRSVPVLVLLVAIAALAVSFVRRGAADVPTIEVIIDPRVAEVTSEAADRLGVSWTEATRNLIGFLPAAGGEAVTHPAPSASAGLGEIVAGDRDTFYFTEVNLGRIGSFNAKTGAIAEFTPPFTLSGQLGPIGWGPDHKLWIGENSTLQNNAWITRLDPATGGFDPELHLVPAKSLADLKRGPGGNMYATDIGGNALFKITPALGVTRFPFPSPSVGAFWGWIAEGCDGDLLWLTHSYYVTSFNGLKFVEYDPPSPGALPFGITLGEDRNVFFTTLGINQIGRLDISPLASGGAPIFTLWGPYTSQLAGILPLEMPRAMVMPLTRGSLLNPSPTPTVPPISDCPAPSFYLQLFPNATTSQLGTVTFPPSPGCPPEPTRAPDVLQTNVNFVRFGS